MIQFDNVTKAYSKESVPVSELSFCIEKGEAVILKGESGSGKSTVLSLLAALTRPDSGLITVDGKQISKLPENFAAQYRREYIGIIFQNFNLIPHLTALENVAVPLMPTAAKTKEINARAHNLLQNLNMGEKTGLAAAKLSGGEQQRTAIARALINNPKIILADEPTANLDRKLTDSIKEVFADLSAKGHTLIIATHDTAFTDGWIKSRTINLGR